MSPFFIGAACVATVLAATNGPEGDHTESNSTHAHPHHADSAYATALDGRDAGLVLPEIPESTTSLGHPYHGHLRDGVKLPVVGPYHRVQVSTARRRWVYGTGYLVRGLLVAAADIGRSQPNGEPLVVGNLSRRGGGDIDMSMSHNTGRDVDLAYYMVTLDGTPAKSEYHRFRADLHSRRAPNRFKLDIPRTWATVKALAASREFEVQWLIVAPYIEEALLRYARQVGEPNYLIVRMERMMMLPGWAKMHDNHIHVRVLCAPHDWDRGCDNAGPVWPWAAQMAGRLDQVREAIAPDLTSPAVATRLGALATLKRRHIYTAVTDIAPLLNAPEGRVRRAARDTLVELVNEANAPSVLKIARWAEPRVAATLVNKALLLAGAQGLDTARAVTANRHPALSPPVRAKTRRALLAKARRLLSEYKGRVVSQILATSALR